jgi:hypothetical protein
MLHKQGSIPFGASMLPVHKFYNVRKYPYKRLSYLDSVSPNSYTQKKNYRVLYTLVFNYLCKFYGNNEILDLQYLCQSKEFPARYLKMQRK